MNSFVKILILVLISLCLTISKILKESNKNLNKSINGWVPELIKNSTNYQSGLVDPENYLANFDEEKNQIYIMIDDLKRLKDIDLTLIFISSISDSYKKGYKKDIGKFVDDLSAIFVGRNKGSDARSLIVLFAINDKQMQIRTGIEIKKLITNSAAAELLKTVKTSLRMKEYGKVGKIIISKILDRLNGVSENMLSIVLRLFGCFSIFFVMCYCCNCSEILKNGGVQNKSNDTEAEKKLNKIQEITKNNQGRKDFLEKSCVICLEDLPDNKENTNSEKNKEKTNSEENNEKTLRENNIVNNTAQENINVGNNHVTKENVKINENNQIDIDSKIEIKENNHNQNNHNNHLEKNNDKFMENDEKIPLCNNIHHVDKETNIAKLDCGHNFHLDCITNWYEKQNKCPVCRSIIVKDENGEEKPLDQGLVEIQREIHPSLLEYVFVFGALFSWSNPHYYPAYHNNYNHASSSDNNWMGGFFEGGWNSGGGADDEW